jgi:hypothetical protein
MIVYSMVHRPEAGDAPRDRKRQDVPE